MFKSSSDSHQFESANHSSDIVETIVGPSVVVEGDFSSEGNILVKGTVSGNVKTAERLTVEKGAKILANVKAGYAIISGEVRGNVRVKDKLELTESAQIVGDISCDTLIVAGGARLHGKVSMKGMAAEEEPAKEKKRSSKSKTTASAAVELLAEAS